MTYACSKELGKYPKNNANIPRHDWHPKISLHLQAFNIMMAEFPDISQLDDGAWDAMVVTGSRMYIF